MTNKEHIDFDKPFQLGEWQVDPDACRLLSLDDEVKLEPKVMTVLICLAQNAGQVMSREQLEELAWKGMVVGYDSLASSIIKLRKALGDNARNPLYVETVPKRGYRLIAEVKQSSAPASVTPIRVPVEISSKSSLKMFFLTGVGALLIAIIFASLYLGEATAPRPMPTTSQENPVIAVLPFKNLSDDPQQEYFSDGITGDLITDLSKISKLSVISRNSVYAYKNTPTNLQTLASELGVNYVVEGSVRKSDEVIRITASVSDARTGLLQWGDRFDGQLKDIFALQDEVTKKIIESLQLKLSDIEQTRLAQVYTNSIEAYDEFLKGWQLFWFLSKDSNLQAREHFIRALKLDEQFARAYANLALTYAWEYLSGWSNTPQDSIAQARIYALKGVALDSEMPQVNWALGLTYMINKEYESAISAAEKILEQEPNSADAYGLIATILNNVGQSKKALTLMQKAMQLNPHYPSIYQTIRGEIHFNLREYVNAIDYFLRALERNPESQEARLWLAASYAHNGQLDLAEWQLENIRLAGINLTLDYVESVVPLKDPVQRKHLIDGLHQAGL